MLNSKFSYLALLIFFVSPLVRAQEKDASDTLSHEKFITMVNFNRDQSYITITDGLGNLEPLLMEAKLSPSYFFSNRNRRWALIVNPSVQIRMLNKPSLPINSPSYRVSLEFYRGIDFWKGILLDKLFYEDALWFVSVNHHSNGQDDPFYLDNSDVINLRTGNFATNFLRFGVASYSLKSLGNDYFSIRELKTHFEYHPENSYAEELDDLYGFYRLFVTYGFFGPRSFMDDSWYNRFLQRSSLELQSGWIFGSMGGATRNDISKRLIMDIKYQYQPDWLDEMAFFIRYYYGQDYYNIHFSRTLSNLTFGLSSSIIRPSDAVRYLGK